MGERSGSQRQAAISLVQERRRLCLSAAARGKPGPGTRYKAFLRRIKKLSSVRVPSAAARALSRSRERRGRPHCRVPGSQPGPRTEQVPMKMSTCENELSLEMTQVRQAWALHPLQSHKAFRSSASALQPPPRAPAYPHRRCRRALQRVSTTERLHRCESGRQPGPRTEQGNR